MPYEIFWELDDNKYGEGILLEKYNDVFSLVSAQKSQQAEGTIYKRWVFPQTKDREPAQKAIPMKVTLGNNYEAIKILKYFLQQLTNIPHGDDQSPEEKEDIPF